MLFEDLYDYLLHLHPSPQPRAEEEGLVIATRLHEVLNVLRECGRTSQSDTPEEQCSLRDPGNTLNGG